MKKKSEASIEYRRVLGVPVDIIGMDETLRIVDEAIRYSDSVSLVLTVNPEKVYVLRKSPVLQRLFEQALLRIPDGIGMVLATRFLFGTPINRVPGADVMQRLCASAPEKGYRIYLYGADEEVSKGVVDILRERHPGIQIVGRANGYAASDDMGDLVAEINAARADILFVALGSPRQEEWMSRYAQVLNVKVCQGIGGTLDTIVGKTKRAPLFMQNIGLEWLYRLLTDPSRWRRQAILPVFVFEVLKQGIIQRLWAKDKCGR